MTSAGAIRVQRLGSAEVPALRQLNWLFSEAFGDPESYRSVLPSDAYLERLLSRDANAVLVASTGDEIIGGLVAYRLDKFEQERSEFYIYDLAVAASWRRRGVATALIEHLRALARECPAWVIYVQADYADAPAIALYEGLGTREEVLHFDIEP